jgi:hypothetical protein
MIKTKQEKDNISLEFPSRIMKIKLSYDLAVTFMGIYLNKGKKIILSEISQTQKEKCHVFSTCEI